LNKAADPVGGQSPDNPTGASETRRKNSAKSNGCASTRSTRLALARPSFKGGSKNMFNSLKYAKKLEEAGFSREQAEVQMQILSDIVEGNLATKGDLDGHVKDLRQEIHDARQQLGQEIHEVDTKIDKLSEKFDDKLLHLEHRMTIKMGTVMTLVLTAFATAYHLLLMLTKTHG
jgi:hypothetical protein